MTWRSLTIQERHRDRFAEGIGLFNEGKYWESHEAWEDVWREETGETKLFLQGLIQAAAAYHLIFTNPRHGGAVRNIEKSLSKLSQFPGEVCTLNIDQLRDDLRSVQEELLRITSANLGQLSTRFRPKLWTSRE